MATPAAGEFIDKVAIVTGASSGLGQATAILFAKKGASVVLCDRDEALLEETLGQCVDASGGNKHRFITVLGDVTKQQVRKSIIDKTIDTFNRLDVLISSAGVVFPENCDEKQKEIVYDEMFNTNVKAIFFLIQLALPHLEKSGGNVVSLSSIGSKMSHPGSIIYPMTKAAVDHMTRCLALDFAPKGVRVNAVNPSVVATRLGRAFGDDVEKVNQVFAEMEKPKQILRGTCVTPEAVADTIAFLASDAAKFVTGQCHFVDGGRFFYGCQ